MVQSQHWVLGLLSDVQTIHDVGISMLSWNSGAPKVLVECRKSNYVLFLFFECMTAAQCACSPGLFTNKEPLEGDLVEPVHQIHQICGASLLVQFYH